MKASIGFLGSGLVSLDDFDSTASEFERKTPPWFTFGIGYEVPGTFAVAADVSYWLKIPTHTQYTGDATRRTLALPRASS